MEICTYNQLLKLLEVISSPKIAYVKCEVPIIVASNRRDDVNLSIFLGDRVYIFSSRKTN